MHELYHHGIMGMHWGVRRFQNEDGSLTNAGRERYGISKRSKEDISDDEVASYRKKMSSQNSQKYVGMSDEQLRKEIVRRQDMTDTVLKTLEASGPQGAIFSGFQEGTTSNLADAIEDGSLDDRSIDRLLSKSYYGGIDSIIRKVMNQTEDDMDYVINEGDVIHRMASYKNTSLENASRALYTAPEEIDRYGYMAFLKDFNGTGKRYDVSLQATEKIVAPSYKKARDIFYNLYLNNSEYRKSLDNMMGEMLEAHGFGSSKSIVNKLAKKAIQSNSPFYAGVWAMGRSGKALDMLIDEYKKNGYTALVDYHDKSFFFQRCL